MAEKLRTEAMRKMVHFFGAMEFTIGTLYAIRSKQKWNNSTVKTVIFGGPLNFIGVWNIAFEAVYFHVSLLNDKFGSNEEIIHKPPTLRRVKDFLMCCIIFPLSMLVSITFWVLYNLERELVLPESTDPTFPCWFNHVLHTNTAVFALLDMAMCYRRWPGNKGALVIVALLTAYGLWSFLVYAVTHEWSYLLFDVLKGELRIVFYIFMICFGFFLFTAGKYVNKFFWNCYLRTVRVSIIH